jgi:TPR repeat protein
MSITSACEAYLGNMGAVKWFRKAADQGCADAQSYIGSFYSRGEGVEKDYAEAVKWYRKASESGCVSAQLKLGWCYANGKGVETNAVEAYKWYHLASAQGNESAKKNLSIREQKMTPAQIAEGQKLAREFKPGMKP